MLLIIFTIKNYFYICIYNKYIYITKYKYILFKLKNKPKKYFYIIIVKIYY